MKRKKMAKAKAVALLLALAGVFCLLAACSSSGSVAVDGFDHAAESAARKEAKLKNEEAEAEPEENEEVEEIEESEDEEPWYLTYPYFEDVEGDYFRMICEENDDGQMMLYVSSYGVEWEYIYLAAPVEDYLETENGGIKYYDTGGENSVMTFYPETPVLELMANEYSTYYCTPATEMNIIDPYGFATKETWWDTYSYRCNMEIECLQDASTGECRYHVLIEWANDYNDDNFWEIEQGTYDAAQNAIVFSDCRYYTQAFYADDADVFTDVYTDGTRSISMDENHRLYWHDDVDGQGDNCVFECEAYYDYTAADTFIMDDENAVIYDFIMYCDSEYFTTDYFEFYEFDQEMCRKARNGIYAVSGRMFDDAELQAYYEALLDWYTPEISPDDFSDALLNDYQIANRDVIIAYETAHGYR